MDEKMNDKIWDKKHLKKDLKEKLLVIARRIIGDLEIEVDVKQILVTGSLASYVWRASSDLDLHIILDPINNYDDDLVDEYLKLFSKQFNNYYSIFIRGYKLELTIHRKENILTDKGVYDILSNTWIQFPSQPSREAKDPDVKDLVLDYQDKIDELITQDSPLDDVDALRKEIKALRTTGLEEDGEFSVGNLVFKELRHSGYIEKLYDFKQKKEDDFLSFESFSGFFNR